MSEDPREMVRYVPWPFPGEEFPAHLAAVVMRSVLSGARPALHVLHDPDGGWAVADGVDDQNVEGACVATHLGHVLALNPSVAKLATMPPGTQADRLDTESEWVFSTFVWDEDEGVASQNDVGRWGFWEHLQRRFN